MAVLALFALPAGGQEAPFQQAQSPAQQVAPPDDAGERVTVVGIVPVPDVGDGAPYRSAADLARIEDEAKREATGALRDGQTLRMCRLRGSPLDARLSFNYPSLELLLDEEVRAAHRVTVEVRRAQATTAAAEGTRVDAAAGNADMAAVEAAELARQAAINKLDDARLKFLEAGAAIADFQELERRGWVAVNAPAEEADSGMLITWDELEVRAERRRKAGWWLGIPVPETHDGFEVQQIEARERTEKNGRTVLVVTGQIRNDRDRPASMPELVVSAIDSKGFVLAAQPVSAGSGARIPAKSARNFAYELRPSPGAAAIVTVSFSSRVAPPPRMRIQTPDDC